MAAAAEDTPDDFWVVIGHPHQKNRQSSLSRTSEVAEAAFEMVKQCASNPDLAASVFPDDVAEFINFCTGGYVPYENERVSAVRWCQQGVFAFTLLTDSFARMGSVTKELDRAMELRRDILDKLREIREELEVCKVHVEEACLNAAMGAFAVSARITREIVWNAEDANVDGIVAALELLYAKLGGMPPKSAAKVS